MFGRSTQMAVLAAGLGALAPGTTRSVTYHDRDVVALHAKVRYTTLIVLPEDDEVVEVTCGDKDAWAVNAHGSLVSVKPAKAGSETNLNVLTTGGRIYAFLITELSDLKKGEEWDADLPGPDLAVYVDRENEEPASRERPKYGLSKQIEDFRLQAEVAREDARRTVDAARAQLEESLTSFRQSYPLSLVFPYRFKADVAPFFVRAMFHDDHVTYIQAHASELPALYEIRDGMPNLVNFDVHDGTYVVSKVLERGYLAVGKQRLAFDKAARYAAR